VAPPAPLTRSATAKLAGYTGVAALSLFVGLALRLPELVAVGAPFALVVALGLTVQRRPVVDATVEVDRQRVLEGEELELEVGVRASAPAELFLPLAPELELVDGANPFAVRGDDVVTLRLRATKWGAYAPGLVFVRAYDRFRVLRWETRLEQRTALKVYPQAEYLRSVVRPVRTQVFAGNQVAREKGDGIEFADLRPFVSGDLVKRVNWRASARRGELWVNEYHPERNADVVLFLDAFAEARHGSASTLDETVRATAALAARYLREKDRVGLVSFGGTLNWLVPATGIAQVYRIVDAALDSRIVLSYAWRDLDVVPRRTLPPHALVLAISPLLDERATSALLDLRARGFDLAVVEVSPLEYVEPGPGTTDRLAHALWTLKREAQRTRYERAGVPVAVWAGDASLAGALEEVRSFRRYARSAR
jgi:uncharacterized protein (DUF58 family)